MGGSVLAIAGYLVSFFAKANLPLLMIGAVVTALAAFPLAYLGNLIIMDLCTYNEYNGMARMDSSTTVLSNNLAGQIGQGIGGALTGAILSVSGYIAAEGDAIVTQPGSTVMAIRILYAIVPLVMMIGIAVCSHFLSKLNHEIPTKRS